MKGTKPAPWFLEVEGQSHQKKGPYTSEEIMKLVMDGALKVESKIFDSVANSWKVAADVIPYLDLGGPSAPPSWQPPPRPSELRDIHVVDLNLESTEGGVDYFALISDRRREMERAQAVARAAEANKASQAAQAAVAARRHEKPSAAEEQVATNRALLARNRRLENPKIVRVAPPLEETRPAQAMREISPSLNNDGIIIKHEEGSSIIDFVSRVREFAARNAKPLAAAAALAFVFAGTYGVVRSMGDRDDNRLPAAADNEPKAEKAPPAPPVRRSHGDPLGSGRHRVARHQSSTLTPRNAQEAPARVVPEQPQPAQNNEPMREEAQFISSRELSEQAEAPQPAAPQNAAPAPAVNPDGSQASSFVDPPGFIPPPDNGNDPARTPTSDPNAAPPPVDTPSY